MKLILLIKIKMPQLFISMINTTYERLKARNFFICQYFSFYEQLRFRAQLSWAWKKFNILEPGLEIIELFISAKQEFYPAHKCLKNANNWCFRINSTSESFKARNNIIFHLFNF